MDKFRHLHSVEDVDTNVHYPVEVSDQQMPLLQAIAGRETISGLDALPDLSVSDAQFRLLARMKRAAEILIALDPDGVEVTDELMDAVKLRLQGRAANWRVLGDGHLQVRFNAAGSAGPDGDATWAFANGMCHVLERRLSAIKMVRFFDYSDGLSPEARNLIDGL